MEERFTRSAGLVTVWRGKLSPSTHHHEHAHRLPVAALQWSKNGIVPLSHWILSLIVVNCFKRDKESLLCRVLIKMTEIRIFYMPSMSLED